RDGARRNGTLTDRGLDRHAALLLVDTVLPPRRPIRTPVTRNELGRRRQTPPQPARPCTRPSARRRAGSCPTAAHPSGSSCSRTPRAAPAPGPARRPPPPGA